MSKFLSALLFYLTFSVSTFAQTGFEANLDRQNISLDESVSLKFTISSGGISGSGSSEPTFSAPDFQVINTYQSSSIESYFENGKIETKNTRRLTVILKPKKIGKLKISGIQAKVDGKSINAPDLFISVKKGSAPPTRLARPGVQGSSGEGDFFLRAELSKDRVFQGEQVLISYYLYANVRLLNLHATKYPDLKGFLREDLKMPILGTRLNWNSHTSGGKLYQRALLAQYAAYPLKEGTLTVDSMEIKASHYPRNRARRYDPNDPFSQFQSFFNQMRPQTSVRSSKKIDLSVESLPQKGRPASFSGVVGSFEVSASVNKYDVRVNDPVNLVVQVEGRGNVSALKDPSPAWPDHIELYETKGKTKNSKNGVNRKVFEFLLIPRKEGKYTLPQIELSFFDPNQKKYLFKKTREITLSVSGGGLAQKRPTEVKDAASKVSSQEKAEEQIRYLKPPFPRSGYYFGQPIWRWFFWIGSIMLFFFFLLVLVDQLKKKNRELSVKAESHQDWGGFWSSLRVEVKKLKGEFSQKELKQVWEKLRVGLLEGLEEKYQLGALSISRGQLRSLLVQEKGFSEEKWKEIERILETAEHICYGSHPISNQNEAIELLEKEVTHAAKIQRSFWA